MKRNFAFLGGTLTRGAKLGLFALIVSFLSALIVGPLFAADRPILSDDQIAAASKPATVLIKATWRSTVIFRKGAPKAEGLAVLRSYAQAQKKHGVSEQAIAAAILQEIAQNPSRYFIATEHHMEQPTGAFSGGSGFIVTPDGYIVTNEHVIEENNEIDDLLLKGGLLTLIMKDLHQFEDALNFDMTQDMTNQFVNAELQYYRQNSKLGPRTVLITAEMAMTVPGAGTILRPFPCDVRKRGQVTPGKDVAILKIEQHDLPTVPIGDDTKLRIGSRIVVLGYPGKADMEEFGMQPGLESTLTQGDLSARKTMPGGWDALQTSAEINHGNSGGPAFDDHGEVIGIATFGPHESVIGSTPFGLQETSVGVRGINFLVPMSVAKEFLDELNIKPQQSRLSRVYEEGLVQFDKHCYKGALEKFKEVGDLNPGFPFVQDKITQSRVAIDQGLDRCWMPSPTYIGAAVAGLLVVLTAAWFLMHRRAVPAAVAVAVPVAEAVPGPQDIPLPTARVGSYEGARSVAALPSAAAAVPALSFGSLQCTAGPVLGRRFEISKQGLLIGRDATKCQIVLADDNVSKEHAWIVPLDEGVVIIDRGSTNGTFVNSVDSPKVSKVRLHHGDRIFIGRGVASFTYQSS